jgi:hypothetical protein
MLSKSARDNFSNDNRCFIFQRFREFAQRKFYTPIAERRHFFLCTNVLTGGDGALRRPRRVQRRKR